MVHMINVCVRVVKRWFRSIELNYAMHCASDSDIELRNVWLTFDRFVDGNVDVSLLDDDDCRASLFYRIRNKHPFRDPNPRRLKSFKAISNCK